MVLIHAEDGRQEGMTQTGVRMDSTKEKDQRRPRARWIKRISDPVAEKRLEGQWMKREE
jgi:hypothetical protein